MGKRRKAKEVVKQKFRGLKRNWENGMGEKRYNEKYVLNERRNFALAPALVNAAIGGYIHTKPTVLVVSFFFCFTASGAYLVN